MRTALKSLALRGLAPFAHLSDGLGAPLRRLWAHAQLSRALGQQIDPSIVVLGRVEVQGSARVRLGRKLFLYRELHLETQESGDIDIGDGVVLSRGVHIVSFGEIRIGAGTIIGEYSSIRDANHRIGGSDGPRNSGHEIGSIQIGRDVWIGRGACILPGVVIGDGAVIGANAVVNRDIPAATVVGGIPARDLHARRAA